MRKVLMWGAVASACICIMQAHAYAQDPLDRDSWNVPTGDWANDDNWVDDLGELSGAPTTQDDRWALVGSGIATVSGTHSTSGLTIGTSGTVDIVSGGSLEIALANNPNSVGQSQIDSGGLLRVQSGGSYKGLAGNLLGDLELAQGGSMQLSGDVNLGGVFTFDVTGTGNASLQVGGQATVGGTLIPNFVGTSPSFGQSITFVQADSAVLAGPTLEFPSLARGLDASLVVRNGNVSIDVTNKPILQVDRGTKDAKIINVIGGPLEITGYAVESDLGLLDAGGFSGFGGASWDRPNPLNTVVAEFSLDQTRSIAVDETLEIGKIYNVGPTLPQDEDVKFVYFTPEGEIREGLVEYVGPANDLVLNVNPETGEVTIQNLSSFVQPVEVTGYSIVSPSGSLKVDAWTSMEDGGQAGWQEANPQAGRISEVNTFNSTIFDNGTVVSLGNIFDVDNGQRDLVLQYTTATELLLATVEYQTGGGGPVPQFLEADFDKNGTVEFADFLFLSAQFGSAVDPPGSPPDINADGTVNFADFLVLSSQFGMSSGGAQAVPEPSGLCILLVGFLATLSCRQRREGGV